MCGVCVCVCMYMYVCVCSGFVLWAIAGTFVSVSYLLAAYMCQRLYVCAYLGRKVRGYMCVHI